MKRSPMRAAYLLCTVAVAALVTFPAAEASCVSTGGATDCQTPDNAQVYAAPHIAGKSGTANPKWSGLGYDPRWSGFEP